MAASLRAAATRTLRPAVLPGEGLRRLVHTEQHFGQGQGCHASLIQQKKEELYEVIAEAEANSAASGQDTYLLKALCTQVEPRPYDAQWRRITKTKKFSNWTAASVFFVASGMSFCGVVARPNVGYHHDHAFAAESLREQVEQRKVPKRVRQPGMVPESVRDPWVQVWLPEGVLGLEQKLGILRKRLQQKDAAVKPHTIRREPHKQASE